MPWCTADARFRQQDSSLADQCFQTPSKRSHGSRAGGSCGKRRHKSVKVEEFSSEEAHLVLHVLPLTVFVQCQTSFSGVLPWALPHRWQVLLGPVNFLSRPCEMTGPLATSVGTATSAPTVAASSASTSMTRHTKAFKNIENAALQQVSCRLLLICSSASASLRLRLSDFSRTLRHLTVCVKHPFWARQWRTVWRR